MFIKCLVIISFIASLIFIIGFSLEYLVQTWSESSIFKFTLLLMAILLMVILIGVAVRNLFTTIRLWREKREQKNNELDQILD
jgi:TRAP-type C4-dicarboxylate transport system permease small subunit